MSTSSLQRLGGLKLEQLPFVGESATRKSVDNLNNVGSACTDL